MKTALIIVWSLLVVISPGQADERFATKAPEVAKLVHDATESFRAGRFRAALKSYQRADEIANGTSWEAVAGASSASNQLEKFSQAARYAERLLEMDQTADRRGLALYLLGVSLAGLNRLPESEAALQESLELRPDRPLQTRKSLVIVLCRQGKHEQGLALLDDDRRCAGAIADGDPSAGGPVRFEAGGGLTEPVKLSGSLPHYPSSGPFGRPQGSVVLESLIGTDGSIQCVKIVEQSTADLGCSAAVAVMDWKFRPCTLNGRPIEAFYALTVNFSIR